MNSARSFSTSALAEPLTDAWHMCVHRQARIDECNCTHYDKLWQMGMDADNGDFFARLQDEFQEFRQMVSISSLPVPVKHSCPA